MQWEDGTPRSTGNAFDWNTGEPTVFLKEFQRGGINQATATQTIKRLREEGKDNSTLYGLSKKADGLVYQFKKQMASAFNVHIATREESDRTNSIRNRK